jgi:flavin-binding protein dodecin
MNTIFEYTEYVGTSTASIEDAVKAAVVAVSATKKIGWFEIVSVRGRVVDPSGDLEYQVTIRFGCKF